MRNRAGSTRKKDFKNLSWMTKKMRNIRKVGYMKDGG